MLRQPATPSPSPLTLLSQKIYANLEYQDQVFRAEIAEQNACPASSEGATQTTSSNTGESPFRITSNGENLHGSQRCDDTNRADENPAPQLRQCVPWGGGDGTHGYVQRQPYGVCVSFASAATVPTADIYFNATISASDAIELGRLLIGQGEAALAQYGDAGDAS